MLPERMCFVRELAVGERISREKIAELVMNSGRVWEERRAQRRNTKSDESGNEDGSRVTTVQGLRRPRYANLQAEKSSDAQNRSRQYD